MYGLAFLLLVAIDQLSKAAARLYVVQERVVCGFISGELAMNKGIAWSMASTASAPLHILKLLVIIASCGVLVWYHSRASAGSEKRALLLIAAGGVSNLIDRLWLGAVTDFILIKTPWGPFPTFNVADVYIVLGVILFLINQLRSAYDRSHT
jgi:signal peptidase II